MTPLIDMVRLLVIRMFNLHVLVEHLRKNGMEILIKDPVALHHQKELGLSSFSLPVSERLAQEVISLPMYPELTDEQVQEVIQSVRMFYGC